MSFQPNTDNVHPGVLLGKPLFVGLELEGVRQGMQTLFVADPRIELRHLVTDTGSLIPIGGQVYLGAGRQSPVNVALATELVNRGYKVTLDVTQFDQLASVPLVPGQVLVTLTVLMMDTAGNLVNPVGDLHAAFLAYRAHPGLVQVKLDWGTRIVILNNDQAFFNGFDGYGNDKPVQPLGAI